MANKPPKDDDDTLDVRVRVPKDTHQALLLIARDRGMSLAAYVNHVLWRAVEEVRRGKLDVT